MIKSVHIDTERTWRGGQQQVLYLTRVLKLMDSAPVVICQPGSPLAKAMSDEGIEHHELNMHGELDLPSAIRIAKIVNESCADIVHAHTSHAHSLAALAKIFFQRDTKIIVSRRVDFPLKQKFLNRVKYKRADKYIAVSNAIKDVMIDGGVPKEAIAVVHSGIDPYKFERASKKPLMKEFGLTGREKIIGNVAALADHKGQSYLIYAFYLLCKHSNKVKLFIVGDGELEGTLKDQVKKLKIEDSVIFTGFREDIGNFYDLFDLFVMSSHLEGLCTSILDALIMNVPVIATNAGGIPEIIKNKHTGLLVEKQKPILIKNAMMKLLSNPDDAEIYSVNGHKFVCDNFEYHLTADKTYEIYQELVE